MANDTSFVEETHRGNGRKLNVRILSDIHGGFGSYQNLSVQKGDPPSLMETGSSCGFIHFELGLGVYSWGVTYHWDRLSAPLMTYLDDQDYVHQSGRTRQGIRTFYDISFRDFQIFPEGGYVFLSEYATIQDLNRKRPDLYDERYKDEGYSYGLSARIKLVPIRKVDFWLCGRYVHDNLSIKADNYRLDIQAGGLNPDPPWVDKDRPYKESAYFFLGTRWTKKTDGRSEWFFTLGFAVSLGII